VVKQFSKSNKFNNSTNFKQMKLIDDAVFLARVIGLMKRKSTGDANEFAGKLDMSKRSLQRLILEMKNEGYPIDYCKQSNSYILTETVTYEFRITVGSQDLMKIKGGRKACLDLIGFENL
jgi:hypothetical protein